MSKLKAAGEDVAVIRPFVFEDKLTRQRIEVRVSPQYSTIHVGERVYYFVRETGEFDGTSCPMRDDECRDGQKASLGLQLSR